MKKTKRLALLAILTAAALAVYVIEAQFPIPVPVPGLKLGLSNCFTVFAMFVLGPLDALAVLLIRVVLGGLLTGQVSGILFSLCGGLASYAVLFAMRRIDPCRQLWAVSTVCAMVHNLAQTVLASFVMGSTEVFWYLPVLLPAAIIAGVFTGVLAQLLIKRLNMKRSG